MLFNPHEPEHREHSHPDKKPTFAIINCVAKKQLPDNKEQLSPINQKAGEGPAFLHQRRGDGGYAPGCSPKSPLTNVPSAENGYQMLRN